MTLKIALTFDDAPSINERKIKFSPERMDTVIAILKKHNIQFCTAFVVGKDAVGNEDKLERWLKAGYKLANHTYSHKPSSTLTELEFKKTVLACHKVLESVGAFSGVNERWFRFPYLDRGSDIKQRKRFQFILDDLGYKVAHASISFNDHRYELPMENALSLGSENYIKTVNQRYIDNVCKAVRYINHQCLIKYGHEIEHIAYAHFGTILDQSLDKLLFKLSTLEIEWCDLTVAAQSTVYSDFEKEYISNGLVFNSINAPSKIVQVKRKAARVSEAMNLFKQEEYGPLWSYLQ